MALSGIRRVTGNAASILASDMVNRATTFILYILIGRYLGPYEFGQMSLALTLFYLFQVLAAAGLKTFITREVARDRVKTGEYIVHGTAAVLITSSLALAALWLFVRVMNYSPDTAAVVLLIGLALLPYSLSSVS
jgi:O-antigen/teichoic acid export membrane protein